MLAKILGGFLLAAVLALGLIGYLYRGEVRDNAQLSTSLDFALKANKTNLAVIDRLEGDLVIAQAEAIADAGARRKLEGETDDLKKAAAEVGGVCPGLDALIRQRRLQREGPGGGTDERR